MIRSKPGARWSYGGRSDRKPLAEDKQQVGGVGGLKNVFGGSGDLRDEPVELVTIALSVFLSSTGNPEPRGFPSWRPAARHICRAQPQARRWFDDNIR
ncbi:MAG: hypothetical protein ACLP50_14505 [Solirubrobacteraceae bacterium]